MQERATKKLREQTQQLLDGPMKHIRGAALAAALLPLASIAATPASAQTITPNCPSGGTCGLVYTDTNSNGIFDTGEKGTDAATVIVCQKCDGTDNFPITTGPTGFYEFTPQN